MMAPSNRRVPKDAARDVLPDVLEKRAAQKKPLTPLARAVQWARVVLGVALVVGASGAVAWAARKYVRSTSRFALREIEVTGAKHRTSEVIGREAGLLPGQNLFATDLDEARAKLLADPWIAGAQLSRRLPDTIDVEVTEREAGAIVALGESYLATHQGELFKRLEAGDPTDLPIVTGLSADAAAEDREGLKKTVRRAIELATDYDKTALATRSPLQEIHVAGDGSFSCVIGKSGVVLKLGAPPFRRKIDQAARVMAELDRRGAKAQTVMLDNDARPERVVVRMR